MGNIVSKEGVKIEGIQQVPLSTNKTTIQSFFGKINFISRFLPNFADIAKPISAMLKKNWDVKWNAESREAFQKIKEAISSTSVLVSPNYAKNFQIISFASEDTIAGILLQKE